MRQSNKTINRKGVNKTKESKEGITKREIIIISINHNRETKQKNMTKSYNHT